MTVHPPGVSNCHRYRDGRHVLRFLLGDEAAPVEAGLV